MVHSKKESPGKSQTPGTGIVLYVLTVVCSHTLDRSKGRWIYGLTPLLPTPCSDAPKASKSPHPHPTLPTHTQHTNTHQAQPNTSLTHKTHLRHTKPDNTCQNTHQTRTTRADLQQNTSKPPQNHQRHMDHIENTNCKYNEICLAILS